MVDLGHAVLDPLFTAAQVEQVSDISGRRTVAVTGRMTEVGAIIGQDRVYLVRSCLDHAAQECRCHGAVRLCMQLDMGKLAGTVNGDEQVKLVLRRLYLGNANMEVADRVLLELLAHLVAFNTGQP